MTIDDCGNISGNNLRLDKNNAVGIIGTGKLRKGRIMGYDLCARNKKLPVFRMGLFFTGLLNKCGYLFPCIHHGARWYMVTGTDDRFPAGTKYPPIIANDGFRVTAEEARIMARIARNYVAVQRTLPDQPDFDILTVKYIDYPFPEKVRTEIVDLFEKFADWAEESRGFTIE